MQPPHATTAPTSHFSHSPLPTLATAISAVLPNNIGSKNCNVATTVHTSGPGKHRGPGSSLAKGAKPANKHKQMGGEGEGEPEALRGEEA